MSHPPRALRAIPTSRPLYNSRRQNRIIVTSFAAHLEATWTPNFNAWRPSRSYAVSLHVRYHLLVRCHMRPKQNFLAVRMTLIGIIIPNPEIEKLYFFQLNSMIFAINYLKNDFFSHTLTVLLQACRKLQLLSSIPD